MAVTLQDVAKAVGVSRQVVATVLTGQGSARAGMETREKILAVAREMGYSPHASARSLATGKSRNIELQAHAVGDSIHHLPIHHLPLWSVAAQVCQEQEYNLLVTSPHAKGQEALTRNLSQRNVDALLLLGVNDLAIAEQARRANIPAICVNPEMDAGVIAQSGYEVINFDNTAGIHAAIDYLVHLGHRDIGFLRGESRNSDFSERWAAFLAAMNVHGLPVRPEWVWHARPIVSAGEELGAQFLAQCPRPTAILAANDNLALGLQRSLLAHGLRIPEELSIMGFDDIEASSIVYPGLTTVRLDWTAMGRMATEHLLARLNEETEPPLGEIRFPLNLVERQSCRPRS